MFFNKISSDKLRQKKLPSGTKMESLSGQETETDKILKECKEFFIDLLKKPEQENKISKEENNNV